MKKATGYAYPPVGVKLKPYAKSARGKRDARIKRRENKTARLKKKAKLPPGFTRGKYGLTYVKGGSSSSANAPKAPTFAQTSNKAIGKAGNTALKKVGAVVTGAVARTVFPRGKVARAKSARIAKAVVNVLKQPAVLRGLGAAAVGAGAYALTRKTKLGGAAGDAVVSAYYAQQDRSEALAMKMFRSAVAKERAKGPVSKARIQQLAKAFGFSTTNR